VILANDQDGLSEVVALDAGSGEVLWKTPRTPYRTCYSTPMLLERPGAEPELVVTSTGGVSGYDPATGSEKWNWNWESNNLHLRTVASPVVSQGLVFFSGGNGPGDRHAVAINLGENGPPTLAWETRKVFPYVPCMLTRGDYLYFVNDSGIAGCHLAKTGENVWTKRLEGGNVTASPLMADGKIYAFNEAGDVFVFAAEPSFKLLASSKLNEGVMASPAVADECLIVRGREHLYCFAKAAAK
jgi:outer membrane protein assembly factor BamB